VTFDLSGAPAALNETRQRRVLLPIELPPSLELGGGHVFRPVHTLTGATMGTYWRARVVERATAHSDDAAQANAIVTRALDEVVARMSPWEPESDLARFARTPPGQWLTLASETAHVLARALEVAALTDGAYSPALGEVTELLGFGPGDPAARHSIDSPQVRAAQLRADYRLLEFDAIRSKVRQRSNGDDTALCSRPRQRTAPRRRLAPPLYRNRRGSTRTRLQTRWAALVVLPRNARKHGARGKCTIRSAQQRSRTLRASRRHIGQRPPSL